MASVASAAQKVPPVNRADNTWEALGGRAHASHRQLIDMACAKLGIRRSHFLIQAAVEKAAQILGVQIDWEREAA